MKLLSLLALCILPLSLAAAEAPRDDAAAEKLGWHLATKAYTFRAVTLYETIETSRALGVKYFEMNPTQKLSPENPTPVGPGLTPEQRAEVKAKFAAAGIQPMSYGVVKLTEDEKTARAIFEFARDLGIATLVSEPPGDALPMLDGLCAEYGMKIAIHNHPEPSVYAKPEMVLRVLEGRSARIGSCSDVGHWTRSGYNTVECLQKLKGHILQLHFKDVGPGKKDVPWGTGGSDVRGMMEELQRQQFQGVLSMEYEGSATPGSLVDELKQSIAYFDQEARRLVAAKP